MTGERAEDRQSHSLTARSSDDDGVCMGLAAKSLAAPHVAPFGSSPLGIKKHPFQGAFLWSLREDYAAKFAALSV